LGAHAFSATLELHDYLLQVDGKNQDVVSDKQTSEGAGLSVEEAKLMYAPNLYAESSWMTNDFRNSELPQAYQSFFEDNYTIGVKELTPYGVSLGLSYLLSHQGYLQALNFVDGSFSDRKFWEGTPKLDVTVSLLRNWLGSETQATEAVTRSTDLITQFSNRYQAKATRAEAENAYVKLVSSQQLVKVYQDSLTNANDIYRFNDHQMKVNLGEDSDFLQAEANVEAQKLLLQSSLDDLRVASRDFNRLRNIDSDTVEDDLRLPDIDATVIPERSEVRDDVRAAQESAKLAAAEAKLGEERNRPTLEAYGSFALNNREADVEPTMAGSFALGQQTTSYGLRFNMPLAFGTVADTKRGFILQEEGADRLVAQKIFQQEVEWKDLVQQLNEAKHRYDIAVSLSQIQKKKVDNERVRLKRGRSTTYQTLTFNIDFNTAEAARIQSQATVLAILARMKTFGEDRL
jgi:outer membrane protein TolC